MTHYFAIDQDKLDEVAALVRQSSAISDSDVEDYCLADWPEGQEHQDWLDTADASEIANWVLAGLANWDSEGGE